jgi:DNA-binding SARP family transcriptional activator
MEEAVSPYGDGDGVQSGQGQQRHDARLPGPVKNDHGGVIGQLEQAGSPAAGKEGLVQRLQHALRVSGNFQSLRLVPYEGATVAARIGRAVLGQSARPGSGPNPVCLKVHCLGRFETSSDGNHVERWQSVKARSVFQYLLARRGQPVAKEILAEMLWPGCAPRVAGNNLKAAVYGLRRTLRDILGGGRTSACLLYVQGSYLISPEIDLWVDVDEFERHCALGRRFEKGHREPEAVREYEKAEALYRGDYLENEPCEEWTLMLREALIDSYLLVLGRLAEHSLRDFDYDGCIAYSQKILSKDPCREDAYRRLMTCHGRLNQRSRALRWYEICRRTVRTELDAEPDDETSALYHRLLKNQPI